MADPRLSRRVALSLGLAAPALARMHPARAAEGRIVMAAWGGGVSAAWKKCFAEPFSKQTGISVTINEVADPSAQIRAQASAPQYNAAIATYVDAANLHKADLIETFDPTDFPKAGAIADRYRLLSRDGRLLGMPAYHMYYGIAMNTDYMRPEQVSSWKDLGDPKWKGQLAVTGPLYGSTYDLTVCSYAMGGDEHDISPGLPLYRKIVGNAQTVFSSMAQMNQLIARGEIAGGPYYSTRIWTMKRDGLTNVECVMPKEGALILPYMVVVPKGSFDRRAATEWLQFVSQPEPQQAMTELAGYLPLSLNAKLTPEQERRMGMSYEEIKKRLIQPDWFAIAAEQKQRADLVEQITAAVR